MERWEQAYAASSTRSIRIRFPRESFPHTQYQNGEAYQAFPRILIQETHGHIKSGTTPALNTVRISKRIASLLCDIRHINRTHAGSEERLVGITPCGVHDQYTWVCTHGFGECLGPLLQDDGAPALFAWEGCIKRGSIGCLAVGEFRNDGFVLETRLALLLLPEIGGEDEK